MIQLPLQQAISGYKTPDFLTEGEKIILQGKVHPAIFWKAVSVLGLTLVLLIKATPLGIFMLFVAGFMFFMAGLTRRFLLLVLTDKRVIIRSGVFFVELIEIRHSQIESAELFYTVPGQIFGYAAVIVSGTGRRSVMVPFIENASEFRGALEQILIQRDDKAIGA